MKATNRDINIDLICKRMFTKEHVDDNLMVHLVFFEKWTCLWCHCVTHTSQTLLVITAWYGNNIRPLSSWRVQFPHKPQKGLSSVMCHLGVLTVTCRLMSWWRKTICQQLIETVCIFVSNPAHIPRPRMPFFPLHQTLQLRLFRHKHSPLSYRLAMPALCEATQSPSN